MKAIRTYSMQSEADVARIALEGANIPAVVVGVGIGSIFISCRGFSG